ncbi:MAG: hypothetical protein ACPGWR_22010 [Ardenticatenaceae bacterium]
MHTFELAPAWLRFLQARHLIDHTGREQALHWLKGLERQMHHFWFFTSDPALPQATERWWQDATK